MCFVFFAHYIAHISAGMMTAAELEALRKEVKRAKRMASERAAELHDPLEQCLPKSYEDIPLIAHACYQACQNWAILNAELAALENSQV